MSTLADVFRELNDLKATGVVREYALGGATAVLFYAEPSRTYDVDVFVLLAPAVNSPLVSLEDLHEWARTRGFNKDGARTLDYDDVPVRVIAPEQLVALAFQAGGARRRERAWQLIESGNVDRQRLRTLLATHGINVGIDDQK